MVTLKTPEAPATSKQLWLLHILTKTDTRKLDITMQEASNRIEELKSNGNHKPSHLTTTSKPQGDTARANYRVSGVSKAIAKLDKRYHGLTGQGLNLGKIQIVQAFKEVNLHHDPETKQAKICVSLKASGIFPGGKKPHIITEFIKNEDTVSICPLFAYIRHNVTVDRAEYHNWIRSLPVKFSKTMPIPEAWHDKALQLAQAVDQYIDILEVE